MAFDIHAGLLFGDEPDDDDYEHTISALMAQVSAELVARGYPAFEEPVDRQAECYGERLGSYSSAGRAIDELRSFAAHVWYHARIPTSYEQLDPRAEAHYHACLERGQTPPSWLDWPRSPLDWGMPKDFKSLDSLGLCTIYIPLEIEPFWFKDSDQESYIIASGLKLEREVAFLCKASSVDEFTLWELQPFLHGPDAPRPFAGYDQLAGPSDYAYGVAHGLALRLLNVVEWANQHRCSMHTS